MNWIMVSYQIGGVSGNQCFQADEKQKIAAYIRDNQAKWKSFSLFGYIPHPSGITTLSSV